MPSLHEMIARATRDVAEGRRIIAEQQKRIAGGTAVPNAEDLLRVFERSVEIMEAHLDLLLIERGSSGPTEAAGQEAQLPFGR